MTEAEKIVTKVSRDLQRLTQLVEGNGSIDGSILGRVKVLEERDEKILERLDEIAARPCRDPCIYVEAMEKEEELRDKKRTWRISDIANYLSLAVLILVAYGMFFQ